MSNFEWACPFASVRNFVFFLTFLFRRSRHHWMVLLTLAFGVILATAFLASGPILIDALMEFGLRRSLLNANSRRDVFYLIARESSDQGDYQILDAQLQDFIHERLDDLDVAFIPSGHVGFMYAWQDEEPVLDRRLTLGFYGSNYNELNQHVDLTAGSLPHSGNQDSNEIPAFLGSMLAHEISVQVGDLVPVSISARALEPEFNVRVKGLISPNDFHDPYWLDHFNPFWPLEGSGDPDVMGVFVERETFFGLAERLFPSLDVSYSWQTILEMDQVHIEDVEAMKNIFGRLGQEVLSINDSLRVKSTLVELLSAYSDQTSIVRAPLYFLIGIVMLMALYYLVMMSSLYLEQVGFEFATLRSRGAPGKVLLKLEASNGLFLSGIAILAGPLLAWLIVRWLASDGPLSALTEPSWGLSLPQAAWLSAGVASVASLGSLLLPLPVALKSTITSYQQNVVRSGRTPWWQRFYLDVFAFAIGIVLFYRVGLYGSIIGGSDTNPELDLLLVLAPLSLLLGTAAIFLRVFPVFLRTSANFASRGRGLPVVLALRQASRHPGHVSRLVLYLMLAMALGLFSTSLDATLTKNEVDRSSYYVGSDLRAVADPADLVTENLPGILGHSWIWRADAALITSEVPPRIDLLAVDTRTFSDVSRFREDFGTRPVAELLDQLSADWEENRMPLPATALPGEPAQIGLWFSLPFAMQVDPERDEMLASIAFEARLHPARGDDFVVRLVPIELTDDPNIRWFYFQGDVPELTPDRYPLSLVSLWFHSSALKLGDFDVIWMDDITVVDRNEQTANVIESFESSDPYVWHSVTYPMRVFGLRSHPHSGESSLAISFDAAGISRIRWYGINRLNDLALQPIPALVSPEFLARTELQVGELVRIKIKVPGGHEWDPVTFKILGRVDYFPTLYEAQDAGFLVTLREPLFEQINLYRYAPLQSNELLIRSADATATHRTLLESGFFADQVISAETILSELRTNPLAIGLRSVTLFGYFLTTALSLVGFGTHFYLSTRQRAANYTILRALGLSPGQLYLSLFLEQVIFMLAGLALGTVLGIMLNQLTLSGLPLRLGELDTIPPFSVQTDWILIFRVYLVLSLAFLLSLGMAILFLWRLRIHRTLRIGEE